MGYLGNAPALAYTSFAKQDFSTSSTTSYVLDNPVANSNELALFINFVRQEPTTSYSASGTTLTLTEATSSSDDMYCVFLGKAVQTVNPPNASVGTSQLATNSVSTIKIQDDAVTKDKVSNLMYPAFESHLSAHQEMSDTTTTKIQFDTERFDTDNYYDNSTNYRYTPLVAGKYNVYCSGRFDARTNSNLAVANMMIFKNGSNYLENQQYFVTSYIRQSFLVLNTTIDMNGSSDYLEVFAYFDIVSTGSGNPRITGSSTGGSVFGAYRIGD